MLLFKQFKEHRMNTTSSKIKILYREEMVPPDHAGDYSKSPTKPRRFMEFLQGTPLWPHVEVSDQFRPVTREDILLAHTARYTDAFLNGFRPLCESNGLVWSPEFRDSVLWTNGSLKAAIEAAVDDPSQVVLAPVSGFHHARPEGGSGFCTLSGQVIAALHLYRTRGLRGVWIDLDGHFGNSIEDSRAFAPDLDEAIPRWANINPNGEHDEYLLDLWDKVVDILQKAMDGKVDYVCVAHGADSHEWDQLGGQCTTEEWLRASELVYDTFAKFGIHQTRRRWTKKTVPVVLALFGGYRDDHPESVLGLHAMDLAVCLTELLGVGDPCIRNYRAEVRAPR